MRPHQWVKNLFVLVPLVFAKELANSPVVLRSVLAFFFFSFAASAVYVLNDLSDVEADRAHPKKRTRPIASGVVAVPTARALFATLVTVSLVGAFFVSRWLPLVILGYLTLNIGYTLKLKHVAYVDVVCIATGFELRVLAGTVAANVVPSVYLLVITFVLASFLGFGKRMHELMQGDNATKQRAVLDDYGEKALRILLVLTGAVTIVLYALYTRSSHTRTFFGTDDLIYTTLFTALGVTRFLRLVTARPNAESPTEEMLRDKWFLLNLAAWAVAVVALIYRSA
jgi:decaprenyl-phosphate phosphoribosyltransferase